MSINIYKYGNGFPLVFFHGWGFDSQIWMALVPKLMTHYQLILIDLPGFGGSQIMDWQLFKRELLSQLPKQFALVGWSMGGLYAMRLALEEPERVDYFISVTSSPRFLFDYSWPGISQEVFQRFYRKMSDNPCTTLREFFELNGLSSNEQLLHLPLQFPSLLGLEFGLNILENWDFREELKQFSRPSCFMFGRLDPIIPVKIMRLMQIDYPKFNYMLFKRAAHLPFLSHMDVFVKEIRRFIQ